MQYSVWLLSAEQFFGTDWGFVYVCVHKTGTQVSGGVYIADSSQVWNALLYIRSYILGDKQDGLYNSAIKTALLTQ